MKLLRTVSGWLVTLSMPVFLIMIAVRLLITPLFAQIEYRLPGFPEDTYGFTLDDRLTWSKISIDYLLNAEGIEWLGSFKLADGAPLYNERELSHMLDVKILVQQMIVVHYFLILLLLLTGLWAWRSGWLKTWGGYVAKGGWFTIGLVAFILAGVAISFDALFTAFHKAFFEGDTWLFRFSDTLIRLFPIRFWQDAFIFMGIITLAGAGLCILTGRWLAKRDR